MKGSGIFISPAKAVIFASDVSQSAYVGEDLTIEKTSSPQSFDCGLLFGVMVTLHVFHFTHLPHYGTHCRRDVVGVVGVGLRREIQFEGIGMQLHLGLLDFDDARIKSAGAFHAALAGDDVVRQIQRQHVVGFGVAARRHFAARAIHRHAAIEARQLVEFVFGYLIRKRLLHAIGMRARKVMRCGRVSGD